MARRKASKKSHRERPRGGPAADTAAEPEVEAEPEAEAGPDPELEAELEAEAALDAESVPADDEAPEDALETDEPADEALADVVSAAPAAELAGSGELHAALEALLFSSPEPLSAAKLARALGDLPAKDVKAAVDELAAEYEAQGRGFRIIEVSGGYQMATQERYAEFILRLGTKKKQAALSGPMLETLAIIAYRQPVIRAVVESIRGVESSGVMRNLLDLELIEVVGRKEVIGRPQMYGTTEKFLRTFGLRSVKDLPAIRGLREKLEAEEAAAGRAEHEARIAAAAAAAAAPAEPAAEAAPEPGEPESEPEAGGESPEEPGDDIAEPSLADE